MYNTSPQQRASRLRKSSVRTSISSRVSSVSLVAQKRKEKNSVTRIQACWRGFVARHKYVRWQKRLQRCRQIVFCAWRRLAMADRHRRWRVQRKIMAIWQAYHKATKQLHYKAGMFVQQRQLASTLNVHSVKMYFEWKAGRSKYDQRVCLHLQLCILRKLLCAWKQHISFRKRNRMEAAARLSQTMRAALASNDRYKVTALWVPELQSLIFHMWRRWVAVTVAIRKRQPIPLFMEPHLPQWDQWMYLNTKERVNTAKADRNALSHIAHRVLLAWHEYTKYFAQEAKLKSIERASWHYAKTLESKIFTAWANYLRTRGSSYRRRERCFRAWKAWAPIARHTRTASAALRQMTLRKTYRTILHTWAETCRKSVLRTYRKVCALSDHRHDVSIVQCAYAWVTVLPRYKQFINVITFLLTWRAWKRLVIKRRRWKAMLLSFRTLWCSHKLRAILLNWRELCASKDKADEDPIQCRIQSITPEGIGTVFVDHLELASETDQPPLFPHWLPITMSCRALSCLSAAQPVTCYPAMSERSNLQGSELVAQFSNAQAQHNTVLDSLHEFVPRFNDTWATTTALVLEDSVTLTAKLLMNSERETMKPLLESATNPLTAILLKFHLSRFAAIRNQEHDAARLQLMTRRELGAITSDALIANQIGTERQTVWLWRCLVVYGVLRNSKHKKRRAEFGWLRQGHVEVCPAMEEYLMSWKPPSARNASPSRTGEMNLEGATFHRTLEFVKHDSSRLLAHNVRERENLLQRYASIHEHWHQNESQLAFQALREWFRRQQALQQELEFHHPARQQSQQRQRSRSRRETANSASTMQETGRSTDIAASTDRTSPMSNVERVFTPIANENLPLWEFDDNVFVLLPEAVDTGTLRDYKEYLWTKAILVEIYSPLQLEKGVCISNTQVKGREERARTAAARLGRMGQNILAFFNKQAVDGGDAWHERLASYLGLEQRFGLGVELWRVVCHFANDAHSIERVWIEHQELLRPLAAIVSALGKEWWMSQSRTRNLEMEFQLLELHRSSVLEEISQTRMAINQAFTTAHELGKTLARLRKELPRTSTRAANAITHAAEALQNKRDLVTSTKKRMTDLTEQLQTIEQVQPMVAARVEKGFIDEAISLLVDVLRCKAPDVNEAGSNKAVLAALTKQRLEAMKSLRESISKLEADLAILEEWEKAQQTASSQAQTQVLGESREHFSAILCFQDRLDKAEAAIARETETLQQHQHSLTYVSECIGALEHIRQTIEQPKRLQEAVDNVVRYSQLDVEAAPFQGFYLPSVAPRPFSVEDTRTEGQLSLDDMDGNLFSPPGTGDFSSEPGQRSGSDLDGPDTFGSGRHSPSPNFVAEFGFADGVNRAFSPSSASKSVMIDMPFEYNQSLDLLFEEHRTWLFQPSNSGQLDQDASDSPYSRRAIESRLKRLWDKVCEVERLHGSAAGLGDDISLGPESVSTTAASNKMLHVVDLNATWNASSPYSISWLRSSSAPQPGAAESRTHAQLQRQTRKLGVGNQTSVSATALRHLGAKDGFTEIGLYHAMRWHTAPPVQREDRLADRATIAYGGSQPFRRQQRDTAGSTEYLSTALESDAGEAGDQLSVDDASQTAPSERPRRLLSEAQQVNSEQASLHRVDNSELEDELTAYSMAVSSVGRSRSMPDSLPSASSDDDASSTLSWKLWSETNSERSPAGSRRSSNRRSLIGTASLVESEDEASWVSTADGTLTPMQSMHSSYFEADVNDSAPSAQPQVEDDTLSAQGSVGAAAQRTETLLSSSAAFHNLLDIVREHMSSRELASRRQGCSDTERPTEAAMGSQDALETAVQQFTERLLTAQRNARTFLPGVAQQPASLSSPDNNDKVQHVPNRLPEIRKRLKRQRMAAFNPAVGNVWGNRPTATVLAVGSERRRSGGDPVALVSSPISRTASSPHMTARRIPFDKTRFNRKAPPRKLQLPAQDQSPDMTDLGVATLFSLPSPDKLRSSKSLPRLSSPIIYLASRSEREDAVPDAPATAHSKSSGELLTTFKLLL